MPANAIGLVARARGLATHLFPRRELESLAEIHQKRLAIYDLVQGIKRSEAGWRVRSGWRVDAVR